MDRAERAQLRRVLRGRGAAIAASWQRALARAAAADQHALAPPGAAPRPEPDVRRCLAELAERAVAVLLAARFRRDGARAIGAALVALHYVDGAALGATQEVLARELGGDSLSQEQRLALQPRLAALLAAVAAGFCDQAREIISTQQAAAREASPV